MLRGRSDVHPRMTGIPHGRSRSSLTSTRVALASLRIRDVSRLARPTEVATMHTTDMAAMLLERLLQRYGPLLTTEDIASELRVRRDVIYNRRSRGSTRGMPSPISEETPQLYRAADLARWFVGQADDGIAPLVVSGRDRQRRGPGRPRKAAGGES